MFIKHLCLQNPSLRTLSIYIKYVWLTGLMERKVYWQLPPWGSLLYREQENKEFTYQVLKQNEVGVKEYY